VLHEGKEFMPLGTFPVQLQWPLQQSQYRVAYPSHVPPLPPPPVLEDELLLEELDPFDDELELLELLLDEEPFPQLSSTPYWPD